MKNLTKLIRFCEKISEKKSFNYLCLRKIIFIYGVHLVFQDCLSFLFFLESRFCFLLLSFLVSMKSSISVFMSVSVSAILRAGDEGDGGSDVSAVQEREIGFSVKQYNFLVV